MDVFGNLLICAKGVEKPPIVAVFMMAGTYGTLPSTSVSVLTFFLLLLLLLLLHLLLLLRLLPLLYIHIFFEASTKRTTKRCFNSGLGFRPLISFVAPSTSNPLTSSPPPPFLLLLLLLLLLHLRRYDPSQQETNQCRIKQIQPEWHKGNKKKKKKKKKKRKKKKRKKRRKKKKKKKKKIK